MQKTTTSVLHLMKYVSPLLLVLLICLGIVGLIKWGSAPALAAASTNLQTVPLANGIITLNQDKGSVIFCSFTSSGSPATPIGKCTLLGTVGKSAAGFIVTPVVINVFINNKTTGGIFQCTAMIINDKPVGSCKEIGNVSTF